MENNNGRGIFYGVIGVATLVVAIIGATFAYFSASAGSNQAINVGAGSVSLGISEDSNFYGDMIPVDTLSTGHAARFALMPGMTSKDETDARGEGSGTCTDMVGNSICGVYEFTISNTSASSSQTVFGRMEVTKNKFPLMNNTTFEGYEADEEAVTDVGYSNLRYAVFKGSATSLAGKYDITGKEGSVSDSDTVMVKGPTALRGDGTIEEWANTELMLTPNDNQPGGTDSVTYTILLWLEENGQYNAKDVNQYFTAAIKFDTGDGQGVTGQLFAAN